MVMLLDSFEDPIYATRLWCIFEAYSATAAKIEITVALPSWLDRKLHEVFKRPHGLATIVRALSNIDAAAASASFVEDETRIKDLIVNTTGFFAVNETVKAGLM